MVRNLGNMCNPDLHKGRLQVPKVIKDYIDEVSTHLRMVCDLDSEEILSEEKLAFMQETRHAFGRTALLLSRGFIFGANKLARTYDKYLVPSVLVLVERLICVICGWRFDEC